jgi:hypothetical protein
VREGTLFACFRKLGTEFQNPWQNTCTSVRRTMTFRSAMDCTYDSGPIIL